MKEFEFIDFNRAIAVRGISSTGLRFCQVQNEELRVEQLTRAEFMLKVTQMAMESERTHPVLRHLPSVQHNEIQHTQENPSSDFQDVSTSFQCTRDISSEPFTQISEL